jgi:hypothetical protein
MAQFIDPSDEFDQLVGVCVVASQGSVCVCRQFSVSMGQIAGSSLQVTVHS